MSGLIIENTKCSLVLRSSNLFVKMNGFVASTSARLCYFNQFDHEVEAVFVYNDNETFITDFRATIGQRKVHTEIHELMSEKDVEESCLCVQDQTEKDFIISIGKIPPNAIVLLEVDVLGELKTTDDGQALVFKTPQVFTPFFGEFNDSGEDICSTTQAYKFDVKIRTNMPCLQLAGCHSPTHAIQVDADADAISAETVNITLAEDFKYDRPITIYFYPAKPLEVYTGIESGIGPIKELSASPTNTRYSMLSANPQTLTKPCRDSWSNPTQSQKESFSRDVICNRKSKEICTEVLINDSIKQGSCAEFLSNIKRLVHKRRSSDLVCPEDYVTNEAKLTICLKEDEENSLNNSAYQNKDRKCFHWKGNLSTVCQIDLPVNVFLKDGNLSHIKLQELNASQGFLRRDSLCKDPSSFEENMEDNGKNISLNDFMNSSENTTSVRDEDRNCSVGITSTWSKQVSEHWQNVDENDVTNSLENTTRMSCCSVENNNLNSTRTTHTRSRHFLSDAIIATSFLPDLSNYPVCGEYIFMLDRSGSMTGSHICNAKESLVLFLKSLPASCYFNVVSFGSYSRSLFPSSQRYTQDSLEKACLYVNSIKADMGGSELLQPLKAVLEKPHRAGYTRNVFVLTDGDVSQPDVILRYLKMKCHKSRIFTFGIGPKISNNTVCNIARSARGKAYFSTPGSKIQTKVIQCLKEVLKPTLCDIKVDWQLPNNWQVTRSSPEIPFAVSGQRITQYTSVQLPSRARKQSTPRPREKRESSSVKEFWFDEELDSCQLGDNMFFEDFQDDREFSGYWGTDTDISTSCSDCEQQDSEDVGGDRNDIGSNKEIFVDEMEGGEIEQLGDELAERHEDEFKTTSGRELSIESGTKFTETTKTEGNEEAGSEFCKMNTVEQETHTDLVKNWMEIRNARMYSSDTSTETEDDGHPDSGHLDNLNNSDISAIYYKKRAVELQNENLFPAEKERRSHDINHDHYQINSDISHREMDTSDDVIIKTLADVTETITNDSLAKRENMFRHDDVLTEKGRTSLHEISINVDTHHLSSNVMHNDIIFNDVMHKNNYITDDGDQTYQGMITHNEVNTSSTKYDLLNNIDARKYNNCKKSKENIIDRDNSENIPCGNYETTFLYKMTKDFCEPQDKTCHHSDCGSVLITGYIGTDIHRERIPLSLESSLNASNGISLHQMAARKFIDGMEAILETSHDNPGVEGEIVELSKESGVPSRMTSSMMVDDMGNVIGVSQDSSSSVMRRRQQLSRHFPKLTNKEDYPPTILVSCPSVDEEPRSPTKRRLGVSTEADHLSDDDGKYYRIERLDPEGCDQVKQRNETGSRHQRKRLVDCRNIPVKAIQRRKLVSTRLTLLTRKMRNAHKLNVFAGPPLIRLILLQSAEGFWQLTYAFARIIGLPLVQLELAAPFVDSTMIPLAEQDDQLGIDCYYDSLALWATALALVYLRRKWRSHEENWELIASKADVWLQRQTFPQGFGYIDVMLAAKQAIVLLEQKYRSRAKSAPVGLYNE